MDMLAKFPGITKKQTATLYGLTPDVPPTVCLLGEACGDFFHSVNYEMGKRTVIPLQVLAGDYVSSSGRNIFCETATKSIWNRPSYEMNLLSAVYLAYTSRSALALNAAGRAYMHLSWMRTHSGLYRKTTTDTTHPLIVRMFPTGIPDLEKRLQTASLKKVQSLDPAAQAYQAVGKENVYTVISTTTCTWSAKAPIPGAVYAQILPYVVFKDDSQAVVRVPTVLTHLFAEKEQEHFTASSKVMTAPIAETALSLLKDNMSVPDAINTAFAL